jgi:hypothetical protein
VAALWVAQFAALHRYWGLGGSVGLAESAGREPAVGRPTGFVVLGLFGVAGLLLAAAVGGLLARSSWPGVRRRLVLIVGAVIATVRSVRAVGIELLLLTDALHSPAVSRSEKHWTLVLWSPWFLPGGLAFTLAAGAARGPRVT